MHIDAILLVYDILPYWSAFVIFLCVPWGEDLLCVKFIFHLKRLSLWLWNVLNGFMPLKYVSLFSAISDTCVAMNEWVENPHASTALSSILPCVDQATTNKTLYQSKEIINDIVTVVNTYIYTFANANPSQNQYGYYNQSGPFMPPLCYPFDPQLQDRQCGSLEVSMENASLVCKLLSLTCTYFFFFC